MILNRFFIPFVAALLLLSLSTACRRATEATLSGNTLGGETSPYLLQHASNPVHWKPWDDAVFQQAQKENKLLVISIGYSSCHWCHVMEEETFENDSVAAFMNENFISIKVDREERPDVDQVYMTAVQLMTGSGGWPLNVVALPSGKPVYGGTYHTRERWLQVLGEVQKQYLADPARLAAYADRVSSGIAEVNLIPEAPGGTALSAASLDEAVTLWQSRWDLQWGGNAGIQKFMLPPNLSFLMAYTQLTGDPKSREYVKKTLDRMALGGVFDQIGGGFFRYSTDPRWHIPHFEKMLYDNAQLLGVYSQGYQLFSDPEYKKAAEEIMSFLVREMKGPEGGFYSALDADSEGEEGAFYRWRAAELQKLLGDEYELFSAYYGIVPDRAWESEYFVPFREWPDDVFSKAHKLSPGELTARKQRWKSRLLEARSGRVYPGVDDKVITSWNALLISALADAYDAFGEEAYLREARALFGFLQAKAYDKGKLRHSYKPGDVRSLGFLEDYAYLARAAFRLYQVTSDTQYLETADALLAEIQTRFADADSPFYRFGEPSGLVAEIIKTDDGVMPSPNAVVAGLFFELGHFYYRPGYLETGREMAAAMAERFLKMPENYAQWGRLLLLQQQPFYEIAIAGPQAREARGEMARNFLPDVLLVAAETETDLPLFESRYDRSATRIFVCQDHACRLPVTEVAEAMEQIRPGRSPLFP